MTDTPQDKPAPIEQPNRSRRSIKRILIFPRAQLRIVFGIPFLAMLMMAALFRELRNSMVIRLEDLRELLPAGTSAIIDLESSVQRILTLGIFCALVTAVLFVVLGLSVSHRFYGPLVPLVRKIKKMQEGNYSDPVHLRPNDELKQLAEAINAFSESLKNRK